ncbi:MAG: hypothetical protein QOC56_336 [Alphaproteobacteria bacterium]|jgi:hypothetical protein|nr:hypothetical protein [Alphaproteobacteria bacterium]
MTTAAVALRAAIHDALVADTPHRHPGSPAHL